MAIQAKCPKCAASYSLADGQAGQKVRCRECQAVFQAPTGGAGIASGTPPRTKAEAKAEAKPIAKATATRIRDRREEADDDGDEPRKSNGLWIGVALGGMAVVILGLMGVLMFRSGGTPAPAPPAGPQVAVAPVAPVVPQPAPIAPQPNVAPKNPNNAPNVAPKVTPKTKAGIVGKNRSLDVDFSVGVVKAYPFAAPTLFEGRPKAPSKKGAPEAVTPVESASPGWKVPVDPSTYKDLKTAPATLPITGGAAQVFASAAPSVNNFMVRAETGINKAILGSGDVQKLSVVPRGNAGEVEMCAVSPDFSAIAVGQRRPNTPVTVLTMPSAKAPNGTPIMTIQADNKFARERMFEFLADAKFLCASQSAFQLADLRTKTVVKTVEFGAFHDATYAISPGRAAFATANGKNVIVYLASTGEIAGSIPMPKDTFGLRIHGLAFSTDGAELALRFTLKGKHQIAVWDVATGKRTTHVVLDKDLDTFGKRFAPGEAFQFLPDKSAFLLNGKVVVDRESGLDVYEFPTAAHRRILLNGWILGWSEGRDVTIATAAFPSEAVAEGRAKANVVREEMTVLAELPPLKPADYNRIANPPDTPNADAAALTVESAIPLPPQVGIKPLRLPEGRSQQLLELCFSSNVVARAAMVHLAGDAKTTRKPVRISVIDLPSGENVGFDAFLSEAIDGRAGRRNTMFHPPGLVLPRSLDTVACDMSPDAKMLALRQIDYPERLDVWDLVAKKHLVGWSPYGADEPALWHGFSEQGVLLTLDGSGKLIGWDPGQCRALFVVNEVNGVPIFSPQRKKVLVLVGATLTLLDAETGRVAGRLTGLPGAVGDLFAGAFSRDGKELALGVRVAGEPRLVRYDLAKRETLAQLVCEGIRAPIQWVSGENIVYGLSLVHWPFAEGAVSLFSMPSDSAMITGSPDNRFWIAQYAGPNSAQLKPFTLPDPTSIDWAGQLTAGEATPLVARGATVEVNVQAGNEEFRNQVQTDLEANLKKKGFTIGPGGVKLMISADEHNTGKVIDFILMPSYGPPFGGPRIGGPFGPRGFDPDDFGKGKGPRGMMGEKLKSVQIAEREVRLTYTITSGAEKIHEQKHTVGMPRDVRVKEGEDMETQIVRQVWSQATHWGKSVSMPSNTYRVNGRTLSVPRQAALGN